MRAQEYFSSGLDVGYGAVVVFDVHELNKIRLVNAMNLSMRDFVDMEMSGKLAPPR